MEGIDARAHPTDMVNVKTIGNRTAKELPGKAMGVHSDWLVGKPTISHVCGWACPQPAAIIFPTYMWNEVIECGRGCDIRILHRSFLP
jgi:hypothetical protein